MTRSDELDGVRERVRARYAAAAGRALRPGLRPAHDRSDAGPGPRQRGPAGFTAITITPTHQVTGGLHSAIIQATKPQHTEGR
jgi:hypothetical protein